MTICCQGDLKCDICEGVIELLDKYVEDNATDEKINQTLYALCSGLPAGALRDLVIYVCNLLCLPDFTLELLFILRGCTVLMFKGAK